MSARDEDLAAVVAELGALPVPVGSVPLRDAEDELTGARLSLFEEEQENARLLEERHSTNEALSKADVQRQADRDRIAELEGILSAATEFRVWEPGYGLYVRRAPGAAGFAILEARRTSSGRRAWTAAGWKFQVLLSDAELFCWRDPVEAVAEARRIMPGALADGITAVVAPTQAMQERPGEFDETLRHRYRVGHDLPEAGGAK